MIAFLWFACGAPEESDSVALDSADTLEIPSIEGIDFEATLEEAFVRALRADVQAAWVGHVQSVALAEPQCPDFYAGTPDLEMDFDDDFQGWVWYDDCQGTATEFVGLEGWTNWIAAESSVENPEFMFIEGERSLVGDGRVRQSGELFYEFDGEGADSIYLEQSGESSYYSYSSYLNGTLSGSVLGDDGSYRTEMYVVHSGGMGQTLEARGNLYFTHSRLNERFDSIALDVEMLGPELATEEDCTLEPRGWIGVRDENAYWYEVVFEPRNENGEYENDPYTECDGCGELYIRGLPQGIQVCPDFSGVWAALSAPSSDDYALVLRTVEVP